MEPDLISVPDELIDALLKFRCPKAYKELMLALQSLSGTYRKTQRPVQISSIAEFLKKDKYKINYCLNSLVECRMLKEIKDARFPKARCFVANTNYKEWTYVKIRPSVSQPSVSEISDDPVQKNESK